MTSGGLSRAFEIAGRLLGWAAVSLLIFAGTVGSGWADEVPTAWQLLDDGDPSPGLGTIAYDTWRLRAVRTIFLPGGGAPITWELVGEDWVRAYLSSPTPWDGRGAVSAFDSDRGVVVLFGTLSGDTASDTWEWDGTQWIERSTLHSPPRRTYAGMVYDSARQRMVLFGGYSEFPYGLGDTWEYDGNDWTQVFPEHSPPDRGDLGMAYDSDRGVVVVASGRDYLFLFRDTWEYDGSDWVQRSPKNDPGFRYAVGMTYDAGRDKTVLFGGVTAAGSSDDDTWEWNGKNWTEVVTPGAPAPRYLMSLAYDTQRAKVLGHGGMSEGDYNDTWEYDGTTWAQIAISDVPVVRQDFAMAYDPLLDATVLYGGRKGYPDPDLTDTWHLTGDTWILQELAGEGSANRKFRLVFDEVSSCLVGFSGASGASLPQDVHEYKGSPRAWVSTPTNSPSEPDGRHAHGWTRASPLGGTLMFGGDARDAGGTRYYANDTWTLLGLDWTEHSPATRPSPRRDAGLAYLGLLGKAVLYGGDESTAPPAESDTWLYDGEDWVLLMTDSPPGPRSGVSLVQDAARERIVLYGDGPPVEGVTWEFDGTAWSARSTPFQPDTDRCWNPLAYDSKREVVILFGGRDCSASIYYNDTWAYGPDPDGDGIVGGLDNCRDTPNPGQANGDGDVAGDLCDCAPSDAGSFSPPVEVTDLALAGKPSTTLTWDDQAPLVGDGVLYDLVSGSITALRTAGGFSGAECLQGDLAAPTYTDTREPPSDDGYYHLVRSKNACGIGSYGPGRESLDASSPCP